MVKNQNLSFGEKAERILENKVTRDAFSPGIRADVINLLKMRNSDEEDTPRDRLIGLRAYRFAQAGQLEALARMIPGMYETWKSVVPQAYKYRYNHEKGVTELGEAIAKILTEKDLVKMQREIDHWLPKAWDLWRALRAPYGFCKHISGCNNPLKAQGHTLCGYHHAIERQNRNDRHDTDWLDQVSGRGNGRFVILTSTGFDEEKARERKETTEKVAKEREANAERARQANLAATEAAMASMRTSRAPAGYTAVADFELATGQGRTNGNGRKNGKSKGQPEAEKHGKSRRGQPVPA
ncbi:hypothetical protein A3D01_00685 [Candidatus Woesebacteria bacterium RIFCSPHIGHO2_02_FULL_39_13]|uniref:Uncharacterized protein n=1 Tax=Candidatus Woesebacteria bacterium RIFCSPHIGHO2_02_FULL_39_13 TaxID=1802505 RepID=A0A1F7YX64_9BACT|nr:MAG: hypothetical protein A3D01_00685 [Candidatus Woesebacteria bacterium RIFCSPHIGHO2_02_FULL_39_13]